jgi:hypothetical protein
MSGLDDEEQSIDVGVPIGPAVVVFKEKLPAPNCPPLEAETPAKQSVLRFVPSRDISEQDFRSHSSLGKSRPRGVDACRWSSCSVYAEGTSHAKLNKMAKLPGLAHMKYVAQIEIDNSSGRVLQKGLHLDAWFYKAFDPIRTCRIYLELG